MNSYTSSFVLDLDTIQSSNPAEMIVEYLVNARQRLVDSFVWSIEYDLEVWEFEKYWRKIDWIM